MLGPGRNVQLMCTEPNTGSLKADFSFVIIPELLLTLQPSIILVHGIWHGSWWWDLQYLKSPCLGSWSSIY